MLFEAGLLLILMPPIAWYLGIGLVEAFVMDLAIAAFYVAYAFVFNLAYDRAFPLPGWGEVAAGAPLLREGGSHDGKSQMGDSPVWRNRSRRACL